MIFVTLTSLSSNVLWVKSFNSTLSRYMNSNILVLKNMVIEYLLLRLVFKISSEEPPFFNTCASNLQKNIGRFFVLLGILPIEVPTYRLCMH